MNAPLTLINMKVFIDLFINPYVRRRGRMIPFLFMFDLCLEGCEYNCNIETKLGSTAKVEGEEMKSEC